MHEFIEYSNIDQYLFLDDFNHLYKVPYKGDFACLKVYYGSQSFWHYFVGNLKRRTRGLTSYMPKGRYLTELECLKTWSAHSINVFEFFEHVKVKGFPLKGHLLLKWTPLEKLIDYLANQEHALNTRLAKYRKFLQDWARRHRLAIDNANPVFTQNNGGIKHALIMPNDEFMYFDFEVRLRSKKVNKITAHIAIEMIKHLQFIARMLGPDLWLIMLAETVKHYPNHEIFKAAIDTMYRHPNPIIRLARRIDLRSKKARKSTSKYSVVADLAQALNIVIRKKNHDRIS